MTRMTRTHGYSNLDKPRIVRVMEKAMHFVEEKIMWPLGWEQQEEPGAEERYPGYSFLRQPSEHDAFLRQHGVSQR